MNFYLQQLLIKLKEDITFLEKENHESRQIFPYH